MLTKKITIKDVAKKLGVSMSTVSRAFNDKFDINPATKEKIMKAATEMGYSPSFYARQLAQKRSHLIGVIVPEFLNAFFPRVIQGIHNVLKERGYQLLILSSNEHAQEEFENVKTMEKNQIDGLLISFVQEPQDISYLQKFNLHTPVVQFNRVNKKLFTHRVVFDDYKWTCKATEHLIEQGCKSIYHFSGPSNLIPTHQREKGFKDTLSKYGLSHKGEVIEAGIFYEDGKKAAEKVLQCDPKPDAIFCFNDPVAIGALEYFREHHVRVPEDIAVVGFTESRIAPHAYPPLTSVDQPAITIGETAANMLVDVIESDQRPVPKTVLLEGKLNIRKSSSR
jgi:LacI family transcriptional regulator